MSDGSVTPRRTALYEAHKAAGARLVPFSGWTMPLHYGSQIDEHHAVRQGVGVFDASHMGIVDLDGDAVLPMLRYLMANDSAKLASGRALYTCMLNDQGGVRDDLIVYRLGEADYRLVINAGMRDADLAWMRENAGSFGVTVTLREDLCLLAVQGPKAGETLGEILPERGAALVAMKPFDVIRLPDDTVAARTGYTGEDGWELMVPASRVEALWHALLDRNVSPCGLGARDTLRLEAGLNLYGQDMGTDITPFECGLGWTVALEPADRDFVGREALAKNAPRARFTGLLLEGRGVLRAGLPLKTDAGEGVVTSGGFSPTLGRSIGLGRIPVPAGDACQVDIRGNILPVRCVKPPFVRRGKVLVQDS